MSLPSGRRLDSVIVGQCLLLLDQEDPVGVAEVPAESCVDRCDQFREVYFGGGVLLAFPAARPRQRLVTTLPQWQADLIGLDLFAQVGVHHGAIKFHRHAGIHGGQPGEVILAGELQPFNAVSVNEMIWAERAEVRV